MPIPSTEFRNFVLDSFGNCYPQFNFAVVFRGKSSKYHHILLALIFLTPQSEL